MNDKNKKLSTLLILTLAAALISTGARIAMTLLYLDADYGVYAQGTPVPTITHILTFILCLAAGGLGLFAAKDYPRPTTPNVTSLTVFTSCITAFLIAASSLLSLYNIVVGGMAADKMTIALIIVSIPAVIYFFALTKTTVKSTPALAMMSFFPTAWFVLRLISVYFDKTLLITSPAKNFHQIALLSIALYMLCESRFILGKPLGKLFFVMISVAPILVFTSSLPAMLFSGRLMIGDSDNFIVYAVEFAMSLFILSRQLAFMKAPGTLPEPEKKPDDNDDSKKEN